MQLTRLYHTLRPLRWQQFWYRALYPLKKQLYRPPATPPPAVPDNRPAGTYYPLPATDRFHPATRTFTFLNLSRSYPGAVDWNDDRQGLLWTYHLNYFGWLYDEGVPVADRLATIREYAAAADRLKTGLDGYPVSLRGTAWIRFFLQHGINDKDLNDLLYCHYHRLYAFPEYALQGNHLWENGCSLVLAGHYFQYAPFLEKGTRIFTAALQEQVLADGGHAEGSPMYHSLLLSRLLQCLEVLLRTPHVGDGVFLELLHAKAARMLGWLEAVTFSDGSWPQVNDSTDGLAPDTAELVRFAAHLGIRPVRSPLGDSGYRMYRKPHWELFADVGDLQPSWQPGHAHADTLSFCLQAAGRPVIVDTGTSTYSPGPERLRQRGTAAHNTATVAGRNSSDVWKSFRVGRRANIIQLFEKESITIAAHDGYRDLGVVHRRTYMMTDKKIIIIDTLENKKRKNALLHLHFHPEVILQKRSEGQYGAGPVVIIVEGAQGIDMEPYLFAEGFNRTRTAQRLRIAAGPETRTIIELENASC